MRNSFFCRCCAPISISSSSPIFSEKKNILSSSLFLAPRFFRAIRRSFMDEIIVRRGAGRWRRKNRNYGWGVRLTTLRWTIILCVLHYKNERLIIDWKFRFFIAENITEPCSTFHYDDEFIRWRGEERKIWGSFKFIVMADWSDEFDGNWREGESKILKNLKEFFLRGELKELLKNAGAIEEMLSYS